MSGWPYNTAQWKKLRRVKLSTTPLCEPCERRGKLVSGHHVDHIVAIASGGDAFPTLDGLMSMCASCHSIKTSAVDRAGGKGIRFKGTDINGLPVDPAHPFLDGDTPSKDEEPASEYP
jgi:5-methylcytosine-specific restriction endonuclease McrA